MTERAGRRKGRRVAIGLGVAVAGATAAAVGQRIAARHLRARPDPEAGVPFETLPPDDLGSLLTDDGTEIAVRASGPVDAPVILFSHGFSLDMTTWYYQWTELSEQYRCVLFDHRAHGRSSKPSSGDYSVRAMGRDLRAVLDHAAPGRPAAIVGHSMGGMAALAFAGEDPAGFRERVRGMVLVDTAASDIAREFLGSTGARIERAIRPLTRRLTSDLDRVERFRGRFRGVTDLAFLIARATQFGPEASPNQVEYIANLSASAPVEVWVNTIEDLQEMDLTAALGEVTVPALVVVGDRDLVTPKTSARALQAALPDARAIVITRAGHVSMMEQHDVFNDLLQGFLSDLDLSRSGKRRSAARQRT
ncbi:MAG TPA: alpha/beta hydrolase [Actinomycetota bacterium]|nr:alpha/beta hydrolase [Actinomycetota bacterium]